MKKKYLILICICSMIFNNSVSAMDYYPEMGMDPFFSELNPNYLDNDMMHEHDTVVNFLKKKKQDFQNKKTKEEKQKIQEEKRQQKEVIKQLKNIEKQQAEVPAVNKETNEDGIVETSDDNFVTPQKKKLTNKELEKELEKEERELERELEKEQSIPLKERINNIFKKKAKAEPEVKVDPNIELSADYMEYFPERFEVEAIGNARILFKAQNTTLTANKIVFNYDRNILRAHEDVVLITPTSTTEGDFVKIDLTKPNGWVENPISRTEDIELRAKEAFLFSDKIEEYDGVAKILKDDVVSLGARSFASYVNQESLFPTSKKVLDDADKGVYKIKARKVIIDSKDDHEVIYIKNADIYLKNHRIGSVPSLKIVTNKQHVSAETNIPEFGSQAMLGMHFGPAVVLNVPGGSTLKLAPIVTYKDDKFGFGGIARFRNEHNMTEVAYGTSVNELLLRGRHKIAPGWVLNYSRYTNQSEWFLGYRMPKYSTQLSYSRTDHVDDLKLQFSQKYSAGLFVDKTVPHKHLSDMEGRFRWMTQTTKPLFRYTNEEETIGIQGGLVAQTAATVYTTGDTTGIFRFGPTLSTKVGPWNQSVMFFETATAGKSPFDFDRYRYGRSNFVFIESLKICKYLSVGYLASLSMNSDFKDDKLFQENRFIVGVGPEYTKLVVGYDARRRNIMMMVTMHIGTKDSEVQFKKSEIRNPDKFGKKKSKKEKVKKKSYKKFLKDKNAVIEVEKN